MLIRQATQRWVKRPAIAFTTIGTYALGIAAVAAMASVVDGVLLRPLPWRAPQELVNVYLVRPGWRRVPTLAPLWDRNGLFWSQFVDLENATRTFAAVGVWRPGRPVLAGENPEVVQALYVSASFLPMLGVAPTAGRSFDADADTAMTDAVLIAEEAAIRRFGGAALALGQHVTLDGIGRTIVGVVPAPFLFDPTHDPPEFCLPFGPVPAAEKGRGVSVYYAVARLRPGVSRAEAAGNAEPIVRGADSPKDFTARVVSLADDQVAPARRPLWLLFGAAMGLFTIAILNVAALFLSDADARGLEIAIRRSLGATALDVSRQLVGEAALIAGAGTALGVLVARAAMPWLVSLAPERLPRAASVSLNPRVLLVVVAASALAALAASAWPALSVARERTINLRDGTRGATRQTGQRVLVMGQVAMAIVLLTGVSLFNESFLRLTAQRLGFDPADLTIVTTRATDTSPPSSASWLHTAALVGALRHVPGVVAAAGIGSAPFTGGLGTTMGLSVEGPTVASAATAQLHVVTDSYFSTMNVAQEAGRVFGADDSPSGHLTVISAEFNRRYFGGEGLGRRLNIDERWWTVIGVVADAKQHGFGEVPTSAVYLLDRQATSSRTATSINQFVIRTAPGVDVSPSALGAAVRRGAVGEFVTAVTPMPVLLGRTLGEERYRATLSALFGSAALLLAAVGLYGLLARDVVRRRREIGVRIALGARSFAVVRMIALKGGRPVLLGLLGGLPAALLASRLMASLLFGVTPGAPHTFLVVPGAFTVVALLAVIGPARQAARVDPLVALRAD